ncbi:terminase large subunit domain-containing protein [uncultured Paludibaculum sp.]|uniref:terminase large subunit domain-containing protein n=1 Tax=uncultured Paludibaculum sp. TaxID=1765020 RepID=UPI002AAA9AC6|nr:terminase family protein [uncultured Paludibaculum sp.]
MQLSDIKGLDPNILANIWRLTPASFARHLTRNEPQPWVAARHLRLLSSKIVEAVAGRTPRLIVNMPPRHGKSEEVSKFTPVWFLDNWPHKTIINVGYSTTFAEEWGRKVRNLTQQFQSQLRYRLSADSKAAGRWNTTQGGGMYATGIDGQITGRGADLFVVDDPHKDAAEANSLTKREAVWRWWTETARSRLMPGGAVILIMTRWHTDDLAGRLLKAAANGTGEKWEVLNLPAIYDDEAAKEGPDPMGRELGQALWPEFRSLEYLQALQLGLSPEAWAAQYQGRPANLVGIGNVYRSFSKAKNVRPVCFDPRRPLCWSLDFNVDPMCSTISQWHEEDMPYTYLTNQRKQVVSVLQEVCLPNSSTLEACEEFVNRTEPYRRLMQGRSIQVRIYGDRSGQSRKTVGDSDYQAIRDFFKLHPEYRVTMHLSKSNPSVKDRVNAVNAMFCNAAAEVRCFVDPSCTELIADCAQVSWKRDSSGNTTGQIDKSDMARTHVTDAFGYFVQKQFATNSQAGEQPGCMQ